MKNICIQEKFIIRSIFLSWVEQPGPVYNLIDLIENQPFVRGLLQKSTWRRWALNLSPTQFAYLPTLSVLQGVSKFFIKSPGLHVRAPNLNLSRTTYRGFLLFYYFFFINHIYLVIFDILKRKIKQEGDLLLLFELFSIGKRKTEQSNRWICNEYPISQKPTNQIAQYMVESWPVFARCLHQSKWCWPACTSVPCKKNF